MAHRGASWHAPENTLEAFDLAVCQGAHVLELDVRLTCDGHVVVSHDETAQRMCHSPLAIERSTLSQLLVLDAAAGFASPSGANPFAGRNVRLATLAQVLHHFPRVGLNIDLKMSGPKLVAATLALVADSGHPHVLLTSFDDRTTQTLQQHCAGPHAGPKVALGLGHDGARAAIIRARLGLSLAQFGPCALQVPPTLWGLPMLTAGAIARLGRAGLPVHHWVVNDPQVAARLLARGAEGIVTDDPGALAQALPRP
jgi:glycerophosphoryl diester phosphodiesterase